MDGAIHRAAGPQLLAACRTLGGCPTGQAKITPGFDLPAQFVIHTVGPVWRGGALGEQELLADCYRNTLRVAREHSIKTIAFPAISCGVYGYPREQAVAVAVTEVQTEFHDGALDCILFCCFDDAMLKVYQRELRAQGLTCLLYTSPSPRDS